MWILTFKNKLYKFNDLLWQKKQEKGCNFPGSLNQVLLVTIYDEVTCMWWPACQWILLNHVMCCVLISSCVSKCQNITAHIHSTIKIPADGKSTWSVKIEGGMRPKAHAESRVGQPPGMATRLVACTGLDGRSRIRKMRGLPLSRTVTWRQKCVVLNARSSLPRQSWNFPNVALQLLIRNGKACPLSFGVQCTTGV